LKINICRFFLQKHNSWRRPRSLARIR